MKTLLLKAKRILSESATIVYSDRRDELETFEYEDHYKSLGRLIARIEEYNSLSAIIKDIENEEFGELGITGDDDGLEDFLDDLIDRR